MIKKEAFALPDSFNLRCLDCSRAVAATVHTLFCNTCGGLFEVEYNDSPRRGGPCLPLRTPANRLSLGEGATPLVELRRLGRELGLGRLWAKLEFESPTGSFKDRGSAVLVSAAVEDGVTEFVEDSSGNAGASLAAYAAAAGITAHIFAPSAAARGKLDQIAIFGATLHAIDGPRQAATDAAREFVDREGLVYLSHNYSPFFAEGMKPFSHEVASSPAAGIQHMVLPVGNGSLLIGARKGFDELVASGALARQPALHCVQAEAVRPIVAALRGETWPADLAKPTAASGISVSKPPRIAEALSAVRDTGGQGTAVTDEAILAWQRRLARAEGIFCEATSAAAFAGLEQLLEGGAIQPGADVLIPITGTGLKEPLTPQL
ncbi:MAG: pyridoxal-phosphate dependent enzyme [Dehalococcoidia bacterium]